MIIGGIDTNDISVVVQGPIDRNNTKKCLRSIRKHLRGAEIILSTWEGSKCEDLDFDVVIYNSDPGGYKDKKCGSFVNNTQRQLFSTQKGVKEAHRKYILKCRSDIVFFSNIFLKYFDKFNKRESEYQLFEHRIIVSSFFTKKYCASETDSMALPFHLSDWIVFGIREDVLFLYDVDLPQEPYNSWYMVDNEYQGINKDLLHASHRYAPEQYIFFSACKKKFNQLSFEHYLDYDRENIRWSERIIANNCIILDPNQWKFFCGKVKNGNDKYFLWTLCPYLLPSKTRRGLWTNKIFREDYAKLL